MKNQIVVFQKHIVRERYWIKNKTWTEVLKENLVGVNPAHVSCVTPARAQFTEEVKATHCWSSIDYCTLFIHGVHVEVDGTLDEVIHKLNNF